MVRRTAFTLIELIFAIVVMSIVIVSLPMMTIQTSKNIESNIVQEAVFASEAVLDESMGLYWDANSQYDENVSGGLSRVIATGGTNDCVAGYPNKRLGHINRRCLNDIATIGVSNSTTAGSLNSITTIYNNSPLITDVASAGAYKDEYNVTANVYTPSVIQFGTVANNPDIKEVAVEIQDDTGTVIVKMRTYIANIGDVEIASRILP